MAVADDEARAHHADAGVRPARRRRAVAQGIGVKCVHGSQVSERCETVWPHGLVSRVEGLGPRPPAFRSVERIPTRPACPVGGGRNRDGAAKQVLFRPRKWHCPEGASTRIFVCQKELRPNQPRGQCHFGHSAHVEGAMWGGAIASFAAPAPVGASFRLLKTEPIVLPAFFARREDTRRVPIPRPSYDYQAREAPVSRLVRRQPRLGSW